jgi:ribokinase
MIQRPRITVVGSLNRDLVARVARLPSPGMTVGGGAFQAIAGGKGANQAVAAARLGAAVTLIGRIGDDAMGRDLVAALAPEGVTAAISIDPRLPTGVALIAVDADGANLIVVCPGANDALTPADLGDLSDAAVVMLQFETPAPTVAAAAARARAAGARVLVNPAPARPVPPELGRAAHWLLPNESEAAALLGRPESAVGADPADAARALRLRLDGPDVVITLGAAGAVMATADGVWRIEAPSVAVIDTVGAGDALCAGFAVALAEGRSPTEALATGVAAGSAACTAAGAQAAMPRAAEVAALARRLQPPVKIG